MELMQEGADDQLISVQVTYPDAEQAGRAARALLEARVVACAQQTAIISTYQWKGAVEEAPEVLLTLKTTMGKIEALEHAVRAEHPYEEPEFLVFPAMGASAGYAKWVRESAV